MNTLFSKLAVCVISYLLVNFLCQKLGIENFINGKTSRRISLFFIAVLINIVGTSIIESFVATRGYQYLLKYFLTGATLALTVFVFPDNNEKTK